MAKHSKMFLTGVAVKIQSTLSSPSFLVVQEAKEYVKIHIKKAACGDTDCLKEGGVSKLRLSRLT